MPSTSTTIDTDCGLLLHCDGADGSTTFTDSSFATTKTVTAVNNSQIDTAQSKFGGASGLFDGTGDYLTVPASSDWAFGTGDFTIDFWWRLNVKKQSFIVGTDALADGGSGFNIFYNSNQNRFENYLAGVEHQFAWNASTATWYHVTFTRNGTNLRMFIDGTQIGSTLSSSHNISDSADTLRICASPTTTLEVNGWIDELRIVKGTAVWTANFTPPAAAYTAVSGTKKLAALGVG